MTHDHTTADHPASAGRALGLALVATLSLIALEIAGGLAFGSLALLADATHVVSDAAALVIALVAQRLARRPASQRHSFGWRRAEVLGANVNAVLLLAAASWIVVGAVRRLGHSVDVDGGGVIVVALIGLVVNLACAVGLHRSHADNVNVRAAMLHTLSDAAGSVGALVAGVVVALGGSPRADAVASLLIACLVSIAAIRLIGETFHVLLEGTPEGLDPAAIAAALSQHAGVVAVHHLHVWSLAPGALALSAHVEMEGPVSLHDAQAEALELKAMLVDRFGIDHSTLELECHPCAPDEASH